MKSLFEMHTDILAHHIQHDPAQAAKVKLLDAIGKCLGNIYKRPVATTICTDLKSAANSLFDEIEDAPDGIYSNIAVQQGVGEASDLFERSAVVIYTAEPHLVGNVGDAYLPSTDIWKHKLLQFGAAWVERLQQLGFSIDDAVVLSPQDYGVIESCILFHKDDVWLELRVSYWRKLDPAETVGSPLQTLLVSPRYRLAPASRTNLVDNQSSFVLVRARDTAGE